LGYDVRIHPTNKQTMFVTDNYAGVIKSTDRGKSWRPANTGITVRGGPSADAYTIFSLTIDPNDPNVVWAGTNGDNGAFGVFKSIAGGGNSKPINSGLTALYVGALRMDPSNHQVLFAATGNYGCSGQGANTTGGLFRTSNGGGSWQKIIGADIFTTVGFSPSS